MITPDGWFDWCERVPGPPDKVYSAVNTASLYIPHSAVGYYPGWLSRLFSTARNPDGTYTDYAAASVHLWFPQSAGVTPKQHFSIFKSCWASGSRYPNTNGVAAENEGGANPTNEPLTPYQIDLNVRAIRELAAFRGWAPRRPTSGADLTATLYEHRECTRFGSLPTSCPSDRIPWTTFMAALAGDPIEEELMALLETPEQQAAFRRFFTPAKWANYDRAHNALTETAGSNSIPWFGRAGFAPADMLAVCAGYGDSVHMGTVLMALGATAPSDPGNLRKQIAALTTPPPAVVDTDAVANAVAAKVAADAALLAAVAQAVLDAEAERLKG